MGDGLLAINSQYLESWFQSTCHFSINNHLLGFSTGMLMYKYVIPCMQHPSIYQQEFFLSWIISVSLVLWRLSTVFHIFLWLASIPSLLLSSDQDLSDSQLPAGPRSDRRACSRPQLLFKHQSLPLSHLGQTRRQSRLISLHRSWQTQVGSNPTEKKEYNTKQYAAKRLLLLFRISSAFFPYLGIPNRLRKKNEAKPASAHVSKENDVPERMPPPPAVKSQ